jgi:hypothetical protein
MLGTGAVDTKVATILAAQHTQTLHHALGGAGAAPQSDVHPAPALASASALASSGDPLTIITTIKQQDINRGVTRGSRNGGGGALVGDPVYHQDTVPATVPLGMDSAPTTNTPSVPPHRDTKGTYVTIPSTNINNQSLPVT